MNTEERQKIVMKIVREVGKMKDEKLLQLMHLIDELEQEKKKENQK